MIPVAGLLAVGRRSVAVFGTFLAISGYAQVLMFVSIGARVPHDLARPLAEGVWPLWRGDRPLPGWVFGNRFARNLAGLAFPDYLPQLPSWAGWLAVVPLVLLQAVLIAGMLRAVREPIVKAIDFRRFSGRPSSDRSAIPRRARPVRA